MERWPRWSDLREGDVVIEGLTMPGNEESITLIIRDVQPDERWSGYVTVSGYNASTWRRIMITLNDGKVPGTVIRRT